MNISVRDLEAFIALADLKNFTRAAARCHLSQSAFSTRVASIEHALGARLFDRTTRSVELTQEGALFLESARRLYGDFSEVVSDFKDYTTGRKGRVAIATLPSIAAAWLPAVFTQFHADNPGIKLTLHDTLSDKCIGLVRDGSVDFAVASRPGEGEDMEARLLTEDNFCLVCSHLHPLASKASLKIRDLSPKSSASVASRALRQTLADPVDRSPAMIFFVSSTFNYVYTYRNAMQVLSCGAKEVRRL